jgi:WD40 repeat protein
MVQVHASSEHHKVYCCSISLCDPVRAKTSNQPAQLAQPIKSTSFANQRSKEIKTASFTQQAAPSQSSQAIQAVVDRVDQAQSFEEVMPQCCLSAKAEHQVPDDIAEQPTRESQVTPRPSASTHDASAPLTPESHPIQQDPALSTYNDNSLPIKEASCMETTQATLNPSRQSGKVASEPEIELNQTHSPESQASQSEPEEFAKATQFIAPLSEVYNLPSSSFEQIGSFPEAASKKSDEHESYVVVEKISEIEEHFRQLDVGSQFKHADIKIAEEFSLDQKQETRALAHKPWAGSIVASSNIINVGAKTGLPDESLVLEHVYGYRTKECRNNLFYTKSGKIIFPAGSVCVVHDIKENTQRFFHGQHREEVTAVAIHPDGKTAASGDTVTNGDGCFVYLWNSEEPEDKSQHIQIRIGDKKLARGVADIEFSPDGRYLSVVAKDDDHKIYIFDWEKRCKPIYTEKGHTDSVCETFSYNFRYLVSSLIQLIKTSLYPTG